MILISIDIMTSVLQSITIAYAIFYCMDKNSLINRVKLFSILLMFIFISSSFVGIFGNNFTINVLLIHILSLFLIIAFYKKNILSALTAFTIIYCIIGIYSIIFGNLIFKYVKELFPIEYIDYEAIFIIYVPQWIVLLLCFKYMEKIKQIYKVIINENFYIIFFTMSFGIDFAIASYCLVLGNGSQLLKNISYIIFLLVLIVILIYFWKINQKSEQIYKLNEALELKNSELRKIKHDYGAQISYLYGLCLMERCNDLKKSLKDIINNNESTPTAVEINKNENSLLSLALKPAVDEGIHVIIEEKCDFALINLNEMEFYKVISNIVNYAVKAMKGQGIIIAEIYEHLGNAVIRIENNRPKIEEHDLEDVFKIGFQTKDNTDKSHGYGLSIVKDLVESHDGKIHVKSNDTTTEFKIILPIQ